MKSLLRLLMLLVVTPLFSQNLSIAPSFAQPVKAGVGAAAVAIISGHPKSIVATLPVSATQNAPAITISVPQVVGWGNQKAASGHIQILMVAVTLTFIDTLEATLKFYSPDFDNTTDANSWQVSLSSGMPADPKCLSFPNAVACWDFPVPSNLARDLNCKLCKDNITIVPSSSEGGPLQFVVFVKLYSNYNSGGVGSQHCASTQTQDPKRYQIMQVVPQDPTKFNPVASVCVKSFSKPLISCTGSDPPSVLDPATDSVASVDGAPISCGK